MSTNIDNKRLKEIILDDTFSLLADYKIGDGVFYKPKLSAFDNMKPLVIKSIKIETHDLFGKEHEIPLYIYSFENTSLSAVESDLVSSL